MVQDSNYVGLKAIFLCEFKIRIQEFGRIRMVSLRPVLMF